MRRLVFAFMAIILIATSGSVSGANNRTSPEIIAQQIREANIARYAAEVPRLIKELSDGDVLTRNRASDYLGKSFDIRAVEILAKHLINDPNEEVRAQCARSLGVIRSEKAIPILIKAITDPIEKVSRVSAVSLSWLGEKQNCLPVLSRMLQDNDRNVRMEALEGLRNVGNLEAIFLIKGALDDEEPYVKVSAAISLSILGEKTSAFPVLRELTNSEDKDIRAAALRGLRYLSPDAKVILLVENALSDSDYEVRERAKFILQEWGVSDEEINKKLPVVKALVTAVSYDVQSAVNYADTWWNGRNPAYHDYSSSGGDCANFVSQCLIAGGLNLSSGPGVDSWGAISICDNLHTNLINSQGATHERKNRGQDESLWFLKGDPAIFGNNSNYWTHAVFAVIGDANNLAKCSAHSDNTHYTTIQTFFEVNPSFDVCNYYHIPDIIPTPPEPPILVSCHPCNVG